MINLDHSGPLDKWIDDSVTIWVFSCPSNHLFTLYLYKKEKKMLWMLFRADGWFVLSFMVEGLTYWCGIEDGHYYSKKGEFSSRTSMVDIDFESTIDGDDNEGGLNYNGNCTTVHVSRRVSIFPSLSGLTGSWTQVRVVLEWRRVRLCCRLSKEKKNYVGNCLTPWM